MHALNRRWSLSHLRSAIFAEITTKTAWLYLIANKYRTFARLEQYWCYHMHALNRRWSLSHLPGAIFAEVTTITAWPGFAFANKYRTFVRLEQYWY
jgi:hypothetical protein